MADAPKLQTQTTILAKPAAMAAANQIASTLNIAASRISTSSNLASDVQVTLGSDAR